MRDRPLLRTAVISLYAMQKLRIQQGNRICAAFRYKLGLEPGEAEAENEEAEDLLQELRREYRRLTDGVKRVTRATKIAESPLITSHSELVLIEAYERQIEAEHAHEKIISNIINAEPIYTDYLANIRGCGVLMSGVILAYVDITKCNSVSALMKYAGLDVLPGENGGEGRCRKAHHLEDKEYTNRDGEVVQTRGITFQPFLKTKLIGVLGTSFLRSGGHYKDIYDSYKHRLENHPAHQEKTKLHRHRMALRYMIKLFLEDLWRRWRALEGLPVRPSYYEEKLGKTHHTKEIEHA